MPSELCECRSRLAGRFHFPLLLAKRFWLEQGCAGGAAVVSSMQHDESTFITGHAMAVDGGAFA